MNGRNKRRYFARCIICLSVFVILLPAAARAQDYGSSVVGTDFDYITDADPSTFEKLSYIGEGQEEMPDKRDDDAGLFKRAYVFNAKFKDNTQVKLVIDAAFGSEEAARKEGLRYVHPLGKLPTALRRGVSRYVVHSGGPDTTAFSDVGLIVIYADNATKRISTHDLEETTFHESVHAVWDKQHARSDAWRQAQEADGEFVTSYAKRNPNTEDLAESALFAYTILHHPDRIPDEARGRIERQIPNRIKFVEKLLPRDKPIHFRMDPPTTEDSDGKSDRVTDTTDGVSCNIALVGTFADILSNSLLLDFEIAEDNVNEFLADVSSYASSESLFRASIAEFELDAAKLKASLLKRLHVNCRHGEEYDDARARNLIGSWQ